MQTLHFVLAFFLLGFYGAPFILWVAAIFALEYHLNASLSLTILTAVVSMGLIIRPIRRETFSHIALLFLKKMKLVPRISNTEREAIEAGNTWVETEFFKGVPDFKRLLQQPLPTLTPEEKSFLNVKVNTLCSMIDDWKIWKTRDLPDEIWSYIRSERFLGMIIPKESGGLGFSPYAHSEVIKKIASKSFVVAIYVMVPNSLGPAELILHYGTNDQKKNYLPKLAAGLEIPCFGLTEAGAGSDAGSLKAEGVVFRKNNELFIRLNWDKRYISLAKISTLIGLAFHLNDPEHLLGDQEDVGITCALIPADAEGITIDKRHDPLGVPFYNCPMHGRDVVISIDAVVGGIFGVGKGWKMLMECLAAGRGISFPAQMAGASQIVSRILYAYSEIREQFGVSINQFEGVQKPMSEIFAFTYLIEALRLYTLSALSQDLKPATVASIAKYFSTEYSRRIINQAMDVTGGASISLGPHNKIAPYYIAAPISITVEGANILTRSLMIFGQGAFRAHPYAFGLIDGIEKNNLKEFDKNLFAFTHHAIQNFCRMILLSLSRGWLAQPFTMDRESKYYRKISWASATFAFVSDITMAMVAGKLKFKEATTGRLADILSNLFLASAVLKKYESEGKLDSDWPIAEYALKHLFFRIETAFEGIFSNFPVPVVRRFLKYPVLWWSRFNPISRPIDDQSIHDLLKTLRVDASVLRRMTDGIYESSDKKDYLNLLETAGNYKSKVKPLLKALKNKNIHLSPAEEKAVTDWETIQSKLVQVDEFTEEEYHDRSA